MTLWLHQTVAIDRTLDAIKRGATTRASDDLAKLPRGPGGSDVATLTPARAAPAESIAQSTRLGDAPKVDIEFHRFEEVAVPMADGCGLRDPSEPALRRGVTGEEWDAFVADCGGLGRAVRT